MWKGDFRSCEVPYAESSVQIPTTTITTAQSVSGSQDYHKVRALPSRDCVTKSQAGNYSEQKVLNQR